MEDLTRFYEKADSYPRDLEQMTEEFLLKLRIILWGEAAVPASGKEKVKDIPPASPQQSKKRIKRLTSLNEDEETLTEVEIIPRNSATTADSNKNDKAQSPRRSKRSNTELLAAADAIKAGDGIKEQTVSVPIKAQNEINKDRKSDATSLMPPPPAPCSASVATPLSQDDTSSGRPKRAAKLKSEKNLREASLRGKLRRPTSEDIIQVKLEHEQRPSQMHEAAAPLAVENKLSQQSSAIEDATSKVSLTRTQSDVSLVVVPGKQPSIVSINSDIEDDIVPPTTAAANIGSEKEQEQETETEKETIKGKEKKTLESSDTNDGVRDLRIKIKREKVSIANAEGDDVPGKTSDDNTLFKTPATVPVPMPIAKAETIIMDDTSSLASTILSSTTNTTATAPVKKSRKKKEQHKPIKVERFSDLDVKPSPIALRTRHNNSGKSSQLEEEHATVETKRQTSIYEDAVETPPLRNSKDNNSKVVGANETVNLGMAKDATMNLGPSPGDATMNIDPVRGNAVTAVGPVSGDATINLGPIAADSTFSTNAVQTTFQVAEGQATFSIDLNPNATVTLNKLSGAGADATFDVNQLSKDGKDDDAGGHRSFETAKDSSMPHADSLLTEDESCEPEKPVVTKTKTSNASIKSSKSSTSTKTTYKMPTRTNELFNPLAQSPVKMRVEAFENAAAAATEESKRPLRVKKENLTPTSNTTPVIGKLKLPALGRFLTPTQGSNIANPSSAFAKKGTISASKALPMPKSASATSLHRSNSAAVQRENSSEDFRKLAEERKKQREQKHLLAAQQREAKERERAERMAKVAKEREEKRLLKKQQEQEQKKRELEEIQRKLRQQQEEEAAKLKAAKERELLMQMKQQQLAKQRMMPPPPKTALKYTFEMLHEDDSTDDEDKVSYKRPPPPSWSRSHVRGPNMLKQEYTPAAYIDSFFSVQPMTPDLKIIFPNIDARYLKRNSSVLWSTPPRYSELPKY